VKNQHDQRKLAILVGTAPVVFRISTAVLSLADRAITVARVSGVTGGGQRGESPP